MKKKVFILTTISLMVFSSTAFAEGTLTSDKQSVYIFDGADSGQFYAKVENTGDTPIAFDNAKLAIFSDNDELILSEDYIDSLPSDMIIQPGEYIYVSKFLWDSALENATIGDVKFSVQTKEDGKEITRIPCEVTYDIKGADSFDNFIYVTITNETNDTVYDYYITAAMTDTEGNVCFVDHKNLETLGVGANSTITVKVYIENDLLEYYETHNITPQSAEAMVFSKNE